MARRSNFYVIFCLLYSLVKGYNLKTFARAPLHSCKDIYSSRDLDGKLRECLTKEYSSFFSYTEDTLYSKDILFKDPLNTIRGFGNYKNNINMLAGRTFLGSKVFANSSLVLHNAEFLQDGRYQTRWTLSSTILFLPWRPRMEFTGVSRYSIREDGLIEQQEDFWDSINLLNGDYRAVGKDKAIADFLNQLSYRMEAEMVAPELPVILIIFAGVLAVPYMTDCVVLLT